MEKVSSVSRPNNWRKEVKFEAAKVMKPRSELNPGVWQGDCFLGMVLIRIARKCFGDRECRCWYSGGQTLIALRIGQKFRTRRWALYAFPMRRATAVRNRPDKARRRLFRLGRDRVEFERCCLTRRRGGAEKHAENIFSGLVSELARLCRKVKTWERGDSGDHTASQRGSRWGGRLTNAARGGYRNAVRW